MNDQAMSDAVMDDEAMAAVSAAAPAASMIRITGGATPAEIAAIIAVVASMNVSAPAHPPRRAWGAPSSAMRQALLPGNGAWRASALPR